MFFMCVLFLFIIKFDMNFTQETKMFRDDYEYIEETESYYKIHTLPRTWYEGKTVCKQEGAILFYPEDETEAIVVLNLWKKTQPFLRWVYVNLTKNYIEQTGGYVTWSKGEPNNAGGNEDCLVMNDDGSINDVNCNNKYSFICKSMAKTQWNSECHIYDLSYKYSEDLKRCYKVHWTPRNWTDAYAICYREQSYLAVVDSDVEANYLVALAFNMQKDDPSRPGAADTVHLGFFNKDGWITRTGEQLHESNYCKWSQSQPDGGIYEECGAMSSEGLLHDISCSKETYFICEHEVQLLSSRMLLKINEIK